MSNQSGFPSRDLYSPLWRRRYKPWIDQSSYSGCDIIPVVYGKDASTGEPSLFTLGNIQTLTYSIHRDKGAVKTLGRVKPKGFTKGCISEDELIYTIGESKRILKPGGLLLVADEVRPGSIFKMVINCMIRLPLAVITYLITQTTIKALDNLPDKIKESGLLVKTIRLSKMENFIELVAKKPMDR